MRRVFGWLILFGLIAVGLLWPLAFNGGSTAAPATDPVVITNYQADFTVADDGTLDAVETITGEFPSGRHGIFRYWDVANQNSPRVRQTPEITSILLDGEPAPYQLLWEDGERFRVAKIGDPDSTLSAGTHVYELRYAIPGVLDPGTTGENRQFATTSGEPNSTSAFFWNVIAPSWNNVIQRVHVRATLPADVTGAQCSVGFGVGTACTDLTVDGNTVEFTTGGPEPPHAGHAARGRRRADAAAHQPAVVVRRGTAILGQSVTGVAWVLGLSVVAGLVGFLWYRTTVEPATRLPGAVRAPARTRTGSDRVHPHRERAQERPDRDAVLSRRAQAGRTQAGQRQGVERPRQGARAGVGRRRPGQHRRGIGAEGHGHRAASSRPRRR